MDKEQTAIERLRKASAMSMEYYQAPLIVTDSGGKDSAVCVELARRAGIPFEVMHSHTTVDAPETVYFVRAKFRELEEEGVRCTINMPVYKGRRVTMWSLIPQKSMPPTRIFRYCCDILKETSGKNRFIVTGVRKAESVKRSYRGIYEKISRDKGQRIILQNDNDDSRKLFENCRMKAKRVCNPIIDWTDSDVWDFIRREKIAINPLYECGYHRVGCIGCPMVSTVKRENEFARYPIYKTAYIRAFGRMLEEIWIRGKKTVWKNAEDVFHWWIEDGFISGQISFDEIAELYKKP